MVINKIIIIVGIITILFIMMVFTVKVYYSSRLFSPSFSSPIFSPPHLTPYNQQVKEWEKSISNWLIYPVLKPYANNDNDVLGITYRLPLKTLTPLWTNQGHYYQIIQLPGGSILAIIPFGTDINYEPHLDDIFRSFARKNNIHISEIIALPKGIVSGFEIYNEFTTSQYAQDIGLVGTEITGKYWAKILKINNGLSLVFILYQDKNIGLSVNYYDDLDLYNQIYSTLKFD